METSASPLSTSKSADSLTIPRKQVFAYAFGQIPQSILSGIFGIIYVEFFWEDLQLPQTLFVIGQVLYATINAANDPFFGYFTDKTDIDRWGSRRLIYIKWGGVVWGFLFFAMWFPWSTTNQWIIFIHFVLSICAFDTIFTLVVQSWLALSSEMTENEHERNRLTFYTNITMIIGMIPSLFAKQIYDSSMSLFHLFTGIAAIISILGYFYVANTCEEKPELRMEEDIPFWKGVKQALNNKSFLMRTGYYFFTYIEFSLLLSFLFAYIYVFDIGPMTEIAIYAGYFGFGWISQVMYMQLAKKWGIRDTVLRLKLVYVVVSIIGFGISVWVANQWIWIIFIVKTLFSGYMVFNYTMLTLVIDEDEVITGNRREGLFMGVGSFLFKPADSLGPILGTSILNWFSFQKNQPINAQPDSAFVGIKIMLFLLPGIVAAISLVFMRYYPLHGKYLQTLQTQLHDMHKEKKWALEQGKKWKK